MNTARSTRWEQTAALSAQVRVLELLASRAPLRELLEAVVTLVETQAPQMACTILLADPGRRVLTTGAVGRMPASYTDAVDGLAIADGCGSCGTAAARRATVIVSDIASSPLWVDFAALARAHGLAACWSTPVLDDAGGLLGTLAMYYAEPRVPRPDEIDLIGFASALVSLVIRRHADAEALRASERAYRTLAESIADAILVHEQGVVRYANTAAVRLLGAPGVDALIGQSLLVLFGAPDLPARLRDGDSWFTTTARRADGTVVRIEITVSEPGVAGGVAQVLVCRDMSARRTLEQALIDAVDREQQRFAHDLHDGLCQDLTGVALLLQATMGRLPASARADLESIGARLSRAISDARRLALGLSPVEVQRAGLGSALDVLRYNTEAIPGIEFSLCVDPTVSGELSREAAVALYRIAQESVANALRHSGASRIEVKLFREQGHVVLTVGDDGRGLPQPQLPSSGLGIQSMSYRAERIGARIVVGRNSPSGTLVRVDVGAEPPDT